MTTTIFSHNLFAEYFNVGSIEDLIAATPMGEVVDVAAIDAIRGEIGDEILAVLNGILDPAGVTVYWSGKAYIDIDADDAEVEAAIQEAADWVDEHFSDIV